MNEIDLVYLYVNGSDKELEKKRNIYLKKYNNFYKPPSIRYLDIGELNYSIKTALKFIPWINKIYIITDNQIPVIDTELLNNKKIKIIDHTEIIPNEYLPTFSSHMIESFIHNIPNLSEIFLCNNDDFFFFDYINENDIYKIIDGKIKLKILYHNFCPRNSEYEQNLLKKIGINKPIYNHLTRIFRKSTLKYIEENYKDDLHKSRLHKFRCSEQLKYIFFSMNIEEYLHNNIKIPLNSNNHIVYQTENEIYNKLIHKLIYKKCKFACYNNMHQSFKEPFKKLMNTVLNINTKCCNNNCNFLRHTDIKNNGGTHCCKACKEKDKHGPMCQKKII